MTRTARPGRTLTPAQVALARRWAWLHRIVFAILAPVTVLVAVLMGAGGFITTVVGFQARSMGATACGLFFVATSILFAMIPPLMWQRIAAAGRASQDTPVLTIGGVYHFRGTKVVRCMLGGAEVTIPFGCLGESPEVGRYYEADAIDGTPPLLVVEIRRPAGSRRDRRRRKRASA